MCLRPGQSDKVPNGRTLRTPAQDSSGLELHSRTSCLKYSCRSFVQIIVPAPLSQQWRITGNSDGYFQIASLNPGAGNTTNVLDDSGGSTLSGNVIIQSPSGSGQELEWNIVSAGNGYFRFVSRVSGLVLDMNGGSGADAGFAVQEPQNNNSATEQWQIVPVHYGPA